MRERERERTNSNKVAIANWEEVEAKMQGKAGQGVKGIEVSRNLVAFYATIMQNNALQDLAAEMR